MNEVMYSGERARNQDDITHEQRCQEATTGFWLPNPVFSFHEDTDMSNPGSGPVISTPPRVHAHSWEW